MKADVVRKKKNGDQQRELSSANIHKNQMLEINPENKDRTKLELG